MSAERPTPPDFDGLLLRARNGDEEARGDLVRIYGPRLLDRIRLMMGDQARQQAESGDFLHETFLQFFRTLNRLDVVDETHFVRWLARVARNSIRDEVRRPRELALERMGVDSGLLPVPHEGASPSAELQRRETRELIAESLRHLTDEHREVIELRNLQQLSFAEVAMRMGRTENAVQLLHTRAMTRMGRHLKAQPE